MQRPGSDLITKHPLVGQPYDRTMLRTSPAYRKCRKTFVEAGGSFRRASKISNSRLWLGDVILGEKQILFGRQPKFAMDVFHQQVHQLLWIQGPRVPSAKSAFFFHVSYFEAIAQLSDYLLAAQLPQRVSTIANRLLAIQSSAKNYRAIRRQAATNGVTQRRVVRTLLLVFYGLFIGESEDRVRRQIQRRFHEPRGFVDACLIAAHEINLQFVLGANLRWQQVNRTRTVRLSQKLCTNPNREIVGRELTRSQIHFALRFLRNLDLW